LSGVVRRPFKAPYEPIHVALTDNDTFIFRPKNASRLCLPADYTNNKLYGWNQKFADLSTSKWGANAFYGRDWRSGGLSETFHVGEVRIVSGQSVNLLRGENYFNNYLVLPSEVVHYWNCNWTHDKASHKYSFEFYLDNDKEESDSSLTDGQSGSGEKCLYDDDETFWGVLHWGTGTIDGQISEDTTNQIKGSSCTQPETISGSYTDWALRHQFSPAEDWTNYEFICVWIKGSNSGATVPFEVRTPDNANKGTWSIVDNFTGWKRFVFPLRNPDSTIGTYDLTNVQVLIINNMEQVGSEFRVDRVVLDVGQWVKIETYIPDMLKDNDNNGYPAVFVKTYDPVSQDWAAPLIWDQNEIWGTGPSNPQCYAPSGYFLDGSRWDEVYGGVRKGGSLYLQGERNETKDTTGYSGYVDTDAGDITYSSYCGCLKRLGFAIKMPPDDGQDSSAYGISQCKLKLEVYYDKGDVYYSPYELYGAATYEFENSTNQYYGLQNINDSWLALFDPNTNEVEFLILSQRPLGLKVRADENELIDRIELTLKKGTVVYAGQLYHADLTRDSDSDGVTDFLDSNSGLPVITSKRDYAGWQ